MKLYVFIVAPNPTRVRLYLAEKAFAGRPLPVEEVTVDLAKGEHEQPEHLARNPRATLPVLELDDGSHLCESLAIIEYLEELHPEPAMIGRHPAERARVRELERVAELGVLRPVAALVHASRSPLGRPANPPVAEYFRKGLAGPLGFLDRALADGRPFVAGERPSIADCTLQAGLQFGRFRDVNVLEGHEHLARWDAAYRDRPPAKGVLIF